MADKIVQRLLAEHIIEESQKELYHYGFELLTASLLNAFEIMLVGMILHKLPVALIYVLILMTVRTQIGGFHADTYGKCFMYYNLFFLITLMITEVCSFFKFGGALIVILLCGVLLVEYIWAPVPHNRKLNQMEKTTARKKGILRTTVWCVILVVFWRTHREWSYAICSVLVLTVGLMWVEMGKKNRFSC